MAAKSAGPRKRRPEQRARIREVAAAAGVSVATVSRTMQDPDVVAEDTRARVMDAIRRLDYTPNVQARMLRTARSQLVVAMLPDIANPFFAEIIRGIERVAHQHGYAVLLGDTQNNPDREQAYADLIGTRQADGLITLSPHVPDISAPKPWPFVNACEYVTDPDITSVYIDNVKAAATATDYLTTLGHTDIAHVTGPMDSPISRDRVRGYAEALKRAGLTRNPALTVHGDFSVESGLRAIEALRAKNARFTAVFCANDEMAIGAIRALETHGMRVPAHVSVVGFDDIHLARYYNPPLTTIAQPKEKLGREAMTLLLERLQDENTRPRKQILPTELVVRASTAPPPRRK